MTHHVLKTDPAVFRASRDGSKLFEVRKDDRAFQKGDTVELRYNDPASPWIGPAPPMPVQAPADPKDDLKPLTFQVGFVLRGGQYGLEPGYVAFSLVPLGEHLP